MRFGLLLAVLAFWVAPPAFGATATVGQEPFRDEYGVWTASLVYRGAANQLSVRPEDDAYLFRDEGGQIEDNGYAYCTQEADNSIRCPAGHWYHVDVFAGPEDDRVDLGSLKDSLRVWLGNGNDVVYSENPTAGRVGSGPAYDEFDGGSGDDILLGGPGADVMYGGRVSSYGCRDPSTCGGRDTIDGRAGDDVIQDSDGVDGAPIDRDVLKGGSGHDTLDYSVRYLGGVSASLDPARTDREDDISGFEKLIGTAGSDDLTGDGANNTLLGGRARDLIFGRTGDDVLSGGSDSDLLEGGTGRDLLSGGPGDDLLRGGGGNDVLRASAGRDRQHAHGGADLIRAADGEPERVYCGEGTDTVVADPRDQLIGCEQVTRRP